MTSERRGGLEGIGQVRRGRPRDNNAGVGTRARYHASELAKRALDVNLLGALIPPKPRRCLKKGRKACRHKLRRRLLRVLPSLYAATKAALNLMLWGFPWKSPASGNLNLPRGDRHPVYTKQAVAHRRGVPHAARLKNHQEVRGKPQKRMDPEKVAKKSSVSAKKRGSPLYIIGAKYKFFYLLQNIALGNDGACGKYGAEDE